MFSSLKLGNITANYEISKQPVTTPGAWKVFDGKKKSTGAAASIFVFDRKSLDVHSSGFGARSSATSIRKAQDEVVERLKREASSLARLRHPSILQLVEPVEDTRSGGLMFATEPITASLSSLLSEKNDQEKSSKYVVENADGTRRRRDVELDELELQKGLLQITKGLEFLHESANLVHGNLNPEAIYVNAKSDWKIAGLSFAGSPSGAQGAQSVPSISLSEVLHHDPRIPPSVQLNLDYTSPDFVLDTNVTTSADIFSLGLLIVALYNFPHVSPLQTNGSQSTYKQLLSKASTVPSSSNDFLSSRPLPASLSQTLTRLLTRRPAQRMTAREFQQSAYFDNILVNTIRFLDDLPAKSANEKAQFMRGLGRVMPQFPVSVLGTKVLSALLDEMKDKELLAPILQNLFRIVETIPSGRRAFPEKVLPRLREVFLVKGKADERDTGKESGLMVLLENIGLISENCSAKEFKDDVLPIVVLAMDSPTHSLVDAALQCLPKMLPKLDFSTVKHDLFPAVASVFSKTSSLSIKVRGLEAIYVLCGGAANTSIPEDDLMGNGSTLKAVKPSDTTSLDKFTMQEKVAPLLKAIKTKEPAVMMAALNVFRRVGEAADTDFLAFEVLPLLWAFSLGPLLDLAQFKEFMDLIKVLSSRIEREQTRKLQDLSSSNSSNTRAAEISSQAANSPNGVTGEDDFARLVLGNRATDTFKNDALTFDQGPVRGTIQQQTVFSWSSSNTSNSGQAMQQSTQIMQPLRPMSRSITPDVSNTSFPALQPQNPNSMAALAAMRPPLQPHSTTAVIPAAQNASSFSLPPPPQNAWRTQSPPRTISPTVNSNTQITSLAWPATQQSHNSAGFNASTAFAPPTQVLQPQQNQPQAPRQGLDKYQSLL